MAKDRPDLEPYVGQELTVIAWLWARNVLLPEPGVQSGITPARAIVFACRLKRAEIGIVWADH